METFFYYIGDKIISTKQNDLSLGARIFCIDFRNIQPKDSNIEGPYNSIEQLKKESTIFKRLIKDDSNRAQRIFEEKNIIKIPLQNPILVPSNKNYSKEFIWMFDHIFKGNIKSKQIFGIHFFEEERMRIKILLGKEDSNKIWKAIVEVYDYERKLWYEKESTFFPKDWTLTQLFNECDYAFLNKVKDDKFEFIYKSQTLTGVPVEIIIKNNEVKSIYPIYNL
jgi:hypothetical protein